MKDAERGICRSNKLLIRFVVGSVVEKMLNCHMDPSHGDCMEGYLTLE